MQSKLKTVHESFPNLITLLCVNFRRPEKSQQLREEWCNQLRASVSTGGQPQGKQHKEEVLEACVIHILSNYALEFSLHDPAGGRGGGASS